MLYMCSQLLTLRTTPASKLKSFVGILGELGLLHYRGTRSGRKTRLRRQRLSHHSLSFESSLPDANINESDRPIPAIVSVSDRCLYHYRQRVVRNRREVRTRILQRIRTVDSAVTTIPAGVITDGRHPGTTSRHGPLSPSVPSLYVLNAAALAKPHAAESLAADLSSYDVEVAVITETHFKTRHNDSVVGVPGYRLLRRDRTGRRGGGVALYVRVDQQSTLWTCTTDDTAYELLWARVGDVIVGALYHPPKPQYATDSLLDYIESCVDELLHDYPGLPIVLAGDFNQLPDIAVAERTGFTQLVQQPTRGANILDRVYVSQPLYLTVRVVRSVVRSDHRAIVAHPRQHRFTAKTTECRTYRKVTPAKHALFLQHLKNIDFNSISEIEDTQLSFDHFYDTALDLLNEHYPEQTVTVTSRDPDYITAEIKSMLRHKNRLMRKGRIEKASALADRIGKLITKRSKSRLTKITGRADVKDMWAAVRQVTGHCQDTAVVDGVSAESLNAHYANISTDANYQAPLYKLSAGVCGEQIVSEWQVFRVLDSLHHTATGLDQLPAWYLRLGAPVFCRPLTHLFNLSAATSLVPRQWKTAYIRPVQKVSSPKTHADFRPISITPVLTRIMERIIVRQFLYSAFHVPPPTMTLSDQFAFRPTGSTTAALIQLLHTITSLLSTNQYVIVIALDFSKAFDTVRHHTLLKKLAQLDIPDNIYNWMVNFFSGHMHCTTYRGETSALLEISASIIQGSAIGPASYVVNAADLTVAMPGNSLCKYADDTYVIIPACNIDTRTVELANIETWAQANNLTLNRSKTKEIVFTSGKRKCPVSTPLPLPGIARVTSLKILGVTITNKLSVSEHVGGVISSCAQSLHGIRVLRSHGMCDSALQTVYRAIIVSKLLYACNAWWGFTTVTDRQRLSAFMRRGVRAGLYSVTAPTVVQIVEDADSKLFLAILNNPDHTLHQLLPKQTTHDYQLRPRSHNRELSCKSNYDDNNFITRMLYKDIY